MGKVISLKERRFKREFDHNMKAISDFYKLQDRHALLWEYAQLEAEYAEIGGLTPSMICRGIPLCSILKRTAEVPEFADMMQKRVELFQKYYGEIFKEKEQDET